MSASRDELIHPERRLPDLALTGVTGAVHRLRGGGRRSPVLVLVHASPCAACDAYLRRLADAADALRDWDGEVMVIAPDEAVEDSGDSPFPRLHDAQSRLAAALAVRTPAVVIADQWGAIHELREAGDAHAFPTAAEVESAVRYLAIQCPECEGEAL
jgi:hypothetical protein